MPSGKLTLRVTDYPQDIVNVKEVRLPSDISYNLITGHSDSLSHLHTQDLIKHFLPQSKHQIVDLSLPYSYTNSQGKVQRLDARYIIFDNRLLAIRVKCGSKWPAGKLEYCRLPEYILEYYRQQGRIQQQYDIPVGHFYLQLNRCKIAIFFESQINQKPASINTLEKFKFDIISVLCDVTNRTNQMRIIETLKKISKKDLVTVIYGGLRIAPKSTLYYDSKSFIIQGEKQMLQERFYLGQPRITELLIDLQETFQKKISKMLQQKPTTNYNLFQSQQSIQSLKPLAINCHIPNYNCLPKKEISFIYNKEKFGQNLEKNQVQLLHLWYIFKTIHKGSPFVIPYPFLDASSRLYNNLRRLEQYADVSIKKLIKVYCNKPNNIVNSKLEVIIYDSFQKMYEENKASFPKYAFIYSHDSSEVNAFKTNSKYREVICNCSSLNPYFQENKKITAEQEHQANQRRKREKACYEVLKNYENLDQILQYFKKLDFYQKDIEACFTQILPRKVQENFKNTPLQYIILNFSKQHLLKVIEPLWDIKKKYLQNDQLHRIYSHSEGMQRQSNTNNLQQQILECKKAKKNISMRKAKCHVCSFFISKKLCYYCRKFKEHICYDCIFQRNERIMPSSIDQYSCLICEKKCQCKFCQPNKYAEVQTKPNCQEFKNKKIERKYCDICIIYQIKKCIFIQCSQCKKEVCYICFKRSKSILLAKLNSSIQKSKAICNICEELNRQKNVTSFLNPITIKQQDFQEQKQHIQIETIANKKFNLPEMVDEVLSKEKSREQFVQPNLKSREQIAQPDLNKAKSTQKMIDGIEEGNKNKRPHQSRTPSRTFSSSSSSSSSSSNVISSSQKQRSKRRKQKKKRNRRQKYRQRSSSRSISKSRQRSREISKSKSVLYKNRKKEKKEGQVRTKNSNKNANQKNIKQFPTKNSFTNEKTIEKNQEKLWPDPSSKNIKRQIPNKNKADPRLVVREIRQISIPKVQPSLASVGQIVPVSNYTSVLQQDHSY